MLAWATFLAKEVLSELSAWCCQGTHGQGAGEVQLDVSHKRRGVERGEHKALQYEHK